MQCVDPVFCLQSVASAKDLQLIIETVVPIGSVLLIAAISALAAYTGQHCNCLSTLPLACMALHWITDSAQIKNTYDCPQQGILTWSFEALVFTTCCHHGPSEIYVRCRQMGCRVSTCHRDPPKDFLRQKRNLSLADVVLGG